MNEAARVTATAANTGSPAARLGLGFIWLLGRLPMPLLAILGAMMGWLLSLFWRRGRKVSATNLRLCFPELPDGARKRLQRAHLRAMGVAYCTIGVTMWASDARLKRLTRFAGREHLDAALRQRRRVILLAPHFLCIDIGGLVVSHERPVVSMYKRAKNAVFDTALRRSRERFGAIMIERDDELRALIRAIRDGRVFYYLPDQDPGESAFVFAPFFGIPTATVTALGRIAQLTDALVIPVSTRFLSFGCGYEVTFEAALENFPSGDAVRDAAQMNAAVERAVRRSPAQYMWTYKRFKTRPPGERDLYA